MKFGKVTAIEGKDRTVLRHGKSELLCIRDAYLASFVGRQHINSARTKRAHQAGPLSVFVQIKADLISH